MIERSEPRGAAPRCAYCHDDAVSAEAEPCDGCGALVHDECLALGQGCPTLGCPFAAEPADDRADPKAGPVGARVEEEARPDVAASDRALPWWAVLLLLAGFVYAMWEATRTRRIQWPW